MKIQTIIGECIAILFMLAVPQAIMAQKFGYIDSQVILQKLPEYRQAEQQVEELAAKWNAEIKALGKEVDSLRKEYLAEEVLLTDEMKKERQTAITTKQNELRDYQQRVFGSQGMLFIKRQELIKPIQDKIYEAVEKVSKKKRLQFMYDKAADLVMLYADPRYDFTDFVLEELGYGDPEDNIR